MARRRLEGLERVLGVNALFSTAYGNVGSSIYYALGLVAALALGLTAGIHVLVTIPVPYSHDIDAPLPEEEAAAESIVEPARLQGGRRVSGHWEKVRAGQGGTSLFGGTLESVLGERPCRVVIESRPEPGRRPSRA